MERPTRQRGCPGVTQQSWRGWARDEGRSQVLTGCVPWLFIPNPWKLTPPTRYESERSKSNNCPKKMGFPLFVGSVSPAGLCAGGALMETGTPGPLCGVGQPLTPALCMSGTPSDRWFPGLLIACVWEPSSSGGHAPSLRSVCCPRRHIPILHPKRAKVRRVVFENETPITLFNYSV